MISARHRIETPLPPEGKASARTASLLLGVLLLLPAGCGGGVRDGLPPPPGAPRPSVSSPGDAAREGLARNGPETSAGKDGGRSSEGSGVSVAALRRDRDRLREEVERLRSERARWDAGRRLVEDLLAILFRALEKGDYDGALVSIDQFLRVHPEHPMRQQVSELRPAVEKLRTVAAERQTLREEIQKLKDIQLRFDALRKEPR
ncbi:MAG: hypothetical protein HYY21_00610 [Candidatus Tectomicrobia bacterium]|nr:hypothetical protein [Candidatus Tectomicrobia bacterium]